MRYVVVAIAAAWATALSAAPPEGFDQRVEALRMSLGVPGVSVAIVENGRTTHARGYGVRDLSAPRPVDADTVFATGSTGKAFTAAALALLVDQGRIKWDEKVIDHMPDFRMYDPWVTREMTIRDMLVHRSGLGLGAGDLLFVPRSNLTRKETVRRLRHIKPASSFRSAYAYDNVLYMVAGQLIEEVTGRTWEEFMKSDVLRPLGMNNSTVDDAGRLANANSARAHARLSGAIRGLGDQVPLDQTADLASNAAPAGGLAISANDMTKWLNVQLARGALPGGGRLFSEKVSSDMWTPVVLMPIAPQPQELKAAQPMFRTYALGWQVEDYRGAKIVSHGGGVLGSMAVVAMIPEKNVGFFVAVNSEEREMVRGLMYELLDHYLGFPRHGWTEKLRAAKQTRVANALKVLQAPAAQPAKVGPSLPQSRYAGSYNDPWYGTVTIREDQGRLIMDFPHSPGMRATLKHWQYDTFRTEFTEQGMEPADVTFGIGPEGKVERITMKAVSPLADFSWNYQDLLFTPVQPTR